MREYLIWSIEHGAWWAPNEMGYVRHSDKAGPQTRPLYQSKPMKTKNQKFIEKLSSLTFGFGSKPAKPPYKLVGAALVEIRKVRREQPQPQSEEVAFSA